MSQIDFFCFGQKNSNNDKSRNTFESKI